MSATAKQGTTAATEIIGRVNMLPPLPAVAMQIIDRLGDEYVDGNEIADIVAQDPAISARLIGLANSAYFGLTVPTVDMRDVVNRVLGADSVRTLAFALATQQAFDTKRCKAFDPESFWSYSLRVATYSKRLAVTLEDKQEETPGIAFITGLCHALGLLVLAVLEPEQFSEMLEQTEDGGYASIGDAIPATFATSLESLTAALAAHWQMPEPICAIYNNAANPTTETSSLSIVLASAIAGARLDDAEHNSDVADIPSRDNLVERTTVYLQADHSTIKDALSLSSAESIRVTENATAMSGG